MLYNNCIIYLRQSNKQDRVGAGDLDDHKAAQAAEKLKAKPGKYKDQGFVFAARNGEPMSDKNILRRHFKPLLESAKLPGIRIYDLRHTCATLLLAAGENPKIVSERLGHASVTLTPGHLLACSPGHADCGC